MGVTVVVCAAFDLTVSEAKTETMCLRSKGMPESTTILVSVEAAGQVYNHTNEFVYFGIIITHTQRMVQLPEVHPRTDDRLSPPLELKIRMLRAEVRETVLYDCVTGSARACHYGALRRAHHSFLTRCIGWRNNNRADLRGGPGKRVEGMFP